MNFKEELDIEKAIDEAEKIVLLGNSLKAGLFLAITEEKDIPKLSREIGGTERSLFIVLEALCAMGYVDKNKTKYIISEKARPLFIQRGDDMLASTERGNTYREAQYRKWLEEASFNSIEILDLPERENQLITAFLE